MDMLILAPVDVFIPLCLGQQLHLGLLPDLLGDDGLMLPIRQEIVVLVDQVVVVTGTVYFLGFSAAIGDLTAVDRISQDQANEVGVKKCVCPVLSGELADTVILQIFGQAVGSNISVDILVKNDPDGSSLFLVDLQLAVNKLVAIRSKATVLLSLSGLLDAAFHGLDTDILPFDLRHGGENGDHQLPGVLGGINAVFYANEVDPEILHDLKS